MTSSIGRTPKLQWTKILPRIDSRHPTGKPCSRSSHGVSWIQAASRLIIYGGEHIARTPLEAQEATWACDFGTDDTEGAWRSITCDPPPLRVAHAQALHEKSSTVYIFGGRAGITMQEKAMNDLWKLDCSGEPGSEKWSEVLPNKDGGDGVPEARSFHKMLCIGDSLYVFGGCGCSSGRLNDMHRFDITSHTWHNLGKSQHLKGRGGATFVPLNSSNSLGVVAGFIGEESNDGQVFDVASGNWADTCLGEELKDMRPRSVCIGGSFPGAGVSLIFGGEVDPSAKGHEGAGGFENDVVVLDEATGAYIDTIRPDPESFPGPRGWSDGAVELDDNGGALFVFGGLSGDDANPERLDDLWKLRVEKA
mmetsp:Transcript_10548/g.24994  ORF Transcript_10548/g.24994 Transcript_10548/m.24994 type:complete len:364 (+) Transcript_10548:266-1357(+)